MEWQLFSEQGSFLQNVNCQYDASDIATMLYNATKVELDFVRKVATIIERSEIENE